MCRLFLGVIQTSLERFTASKSNIKLLEQAHYATRLVSMQCLGMSFDHEGRNIVITRNGLSSNEALADDVTHPGEKGLHVYGSGVVLWVVRGLLRRCRIDNKESGGCIIVLLKP